MKLKMKLISSIKKLQMLMKFWGFKIINYRFWRAKDNEITNGNNMIDDLQA